MAQIEKNKKKKGRPSKADLEARRRLHVSSTPLVDSHQNQLDLRRSLRRRSFRYNIIDYDEDYLDDDELFEEEDEEDEQGDDEDEEERIEKKVKLVVKLNSGESNISRGRRGTSRDSVNRRGRVRTRRDSDEEDDDEEEDEGERVVKKRRVVRRREDEDDGDDDGEDDGDDDGEDDDDQDDDVVNGGIDEGRDGKGGAKKEDYDVPGTPTAKGNDGGDQRPTPLPEKKQLEIVLDKLQKKDTYGVYAEPVDPDELPDYHEVIEHPMDFSTVRKKLADGCYPTLEEFESDVFLISSNAMQYNAPDTIYHKQARTIKELAEKKFQRIRIRIERMDQEPKSEPKSDPKFELKSEQKERPSPLVKKLTKKPFDCPTQEPVKSDFTCGATLATADAHNGYKADHAGHYERPINSNGPVEDIFFLADNNMEKAEDPQSGKGVVPKFGRKSFVGDENRRATYNLSNQHEERSESIFTTFEGDMKQLIPVGLSGEFSYARSLARFAANLGPPALRIASKRVEQALPPGFKYGRGWIGEYEPLTTAVYIFEQRKDPLVLRSDDVDSGKRNKIPESQVSATSHLRRQPSSDEKCGTVFGSSGVKPPATVSSPHHIPIMGASEGHANTMPKRVDSNCSSADNLKSISMFQQHGKLPRDSSCSETVGVRRLDQNSPSISDHKQDYVHQRERPRSVEVGERRAEPNSSVVSNQKTDDLSQKQSRAEIPASRPVESAPRGTSFLQSLPFKQPNSNGGIPSGLANGKVRNNVADSIRVSTLSPGTTSSHPAGAGASFPQRQDQGLSDPVLVMKMMTERAQRQQNESASPHNPSLARPSVPSPRSDAGGNAAAVAASAWMSVGALGFRPPAQSHAVNQNPISTGSLHNGTRVFYPQAMPSRADCPVSVPMHFHQGKKGMPFQAFAPQPLKGSSEAQVQNRPMVFPQLATNDLARFQIQAHWRGLSPHTQQKQKQDTLPPDLNVAFQSPVDSQQPDLALQL